MEEEQGSVPFGYVPDKVLWKDLVKRVIGWPNLVRRLQASVIMRMLSLTSEDRVLDVGCGGGHFVLEMAKKCRVCVGLDLIVLDSVHSVAQVQKNTSFLVADARCIPIPDAAFDKLLLSSVLQMIPGDSQVLQECARTLHPGGKLVLSVPLDYVLIRRLYQSGSGRVRKGIGWLALPATYSELKKDFGRRFGAKGQGYYTLYEVTKLLEDSEFEIEAIECAPKKLGSVIFELYLLFCNRLRLKLYSRWGFPLLYPIAYFDRFLGKSSLGCEVIISAVKR